MNVYITKLNGLPMQDISQYKQRMTAEIGHQLGFREMGIYRYNGAGESKESLSGRLDGIIAGIDWGNDVVICQFPTGNGLRYEWELVNRLKMYQSKVVIFIHNIEGLAKEANRSKLTETVRLYNQAEVLIVPSLAMRQFLLDNGTKKDMKFIIQEMWDYTTDMNFYSLPQFRKEIHFADGSDFEGMDDWNNMLSLKVYAEGQNVYNMGELPQGELLFALSKGGVGLVWYQNENSRRCMEYEASFSLARYLAAGIPAIVPTGISNQMLIEKNHLGLIVHSLDEAAAKIESMTESEYRGYIQSIRQFAPALRKGYYTKKCLVDTVHAIYRKDACEITIPANVYELGERGFTYAGLKESYGGNLALSWSYHGEADGFLVYDTSENLIYETRNLHQHYFVIRGYGTENRFIIKAYIDTLKGRMSVAETKPIYLQAQQYNHPDVSLVIPAYNAQDYIVRSIDVALAQSFSNLEIIIVDDGSSDDTADVVDWYAEKYANVTALHQQNKGAAAARNLGIEYAHGDYIGFLDSDDMIYPDMVYRLYHSVKKNNCDIVITSAYWIKENSYKVFVQYPMSESVAISVDEFFNRYYGNGGYGVVIWNKLYSASLVKSHLFPVIPVEDEAWTPYILSYAERICYIDGLAYEYDRSICNTTLSQRVECQSKEAFFVARREAILFYLKNSNPQRTSLLKKLAKKQLSELEKAYGYDAYAKLWKQIDETF